jgi:ankyrin repeat protein
LQNAIYYVFLQAQKKNSKTRRLGFILKKGKGNIMKSSRQYVPSYDLDDYDINDLIYGVQANYTAYVKKMLKNGVDINAVGSEGVTPLYVATNKNNDYMVDYLLKYGASPDIATTSGLFPIHLASKLGSIKIVETLLKYHANINALSFGNYSPLMLAAMKGDENTALYLIEQGANISLKDENGYSVIHFAAIYKQKKLLKALAEKGIDLDQTTGLAAYDEYKICLSNPSTFIFNAIKLNLTEMVGLILRECQHIVTKINQPQTAKSLATLFNHTDVIDLIDKLKSNANSYNNVRNNSIEGQHMLPSSTINFLPYELPNATVDFLPQELTDTIVNYTEQELLGMHTIPNPSCVAEGFILCSW